MRTSAGAPAGPRGLARAGAVTLAVLLAWVAGAHGDDAAARAMLLRYAGSYDSAALCRSRRRSCA